MDVMFTTPPEGGSGKYYMVVATAEEWADIVADLREVRGGIYSATSEMIVGLEGWGI